MTAFEEYDGNVRKPHIQLETHEVIKGSGKCVNASSTILYEPGTIFIMQAGVPHEFTAGVEGLYLFAKFMPALC